MSETSGSSDTTKQPLVNKLDFQALYAGLAQNGQPLTAAEKARLEEIAREEIKKQNGGDIIGGNIGGGAVNFVFMLFSFIQQLFSGQASLPTSIKDFGSQLSGASDGANNQTKQYVINTIMSNIDDRLQREGGNLAAVSDLITGLKSGGDNARDMNSLLMRQLMAAQNVPFGTNGSLASHRNHRSPRKNPANKAATACPQA